MLIRRVPGAVGSRAARAFASASGQYLEAATGLGLGASDPFYIVTYARRTATGGFPVIVSIGTGGTANNSCWLYSHTGTANNIAAVSINAAGGFYRATIDGGWPVDGTFYSLIAEFSDDNTRRMISNGTAVTTIGTITRSAPALIRIGREPHTAAAVLDGVVPHVAIFAGTASDSLISLHRRGVHPTRLPGQLLECWDLDRVGPIRGLVRGTVLSPTGGGSLAPGPSWAQGPNRVYRMPVGDVFAGTTNYTLTADAGAATIAGTTATTLYQRVVQAAADTVTATGTTASALYNRVVAALSTAWALTGQTAGAFYQRVVSALSSAVDITTTTATTLWHRVTGAQTASVDVTGTTATLTYSGDTGPTAEQRKKQFLLMGVMKALLLALWSDHV